MTQKRSNPVLQQWLCGGVPHPLHSPVSLSRDEPTLRWSWCCGRQGRSLTPLPEGSTSSLPHQVAPPALLTHQTAELVWQGVKKWLFQLDRIQKAVHSGGAGGSGRAQASATSQGEGPTAGTGDIFILFLCKNTSKLHAKNQNTDGSVHTEKLKNVTQLSPVIMLTHSALVLPLLCTADQSSNYIMTYYFHCS